MAIDLKIINLQDPKPGACFVLRTPQHVTLGKAASAATHLVSFTPDNTVNLFPPPSLAVALHPNLYHSTIALLPYPPSASILVPQNPPLLRFPIKTAQPLVLPRVV